MLRVSITATLILLGYLAINDIIDGLQDMHHQRLDRLQTPGTVD